MKQIAYYATFVDVCTEIAIFQTKAERDDWVNYQDWHSIATGTTADNSPLERRALSQSDAEFIAGDLLNCPECFDRDALLDNVQWVVII